MKKFALICALLGVTCGFAACSSDDDDSADKKSNGASCSAAEECKSGICTDGKCAAASSDDKKDDGADCAKAEECKSGVCTDGKCVAASEEDPCKDKNEGDECAENSYCIEGVCTLVEGCKSDDDCTSEYPTCDTEKELCYKADTETKPSCSTEGGGNKLLKDHIIYSDGSVDHTEVVCEGDTPVCDATAVDCVADKICTLDTDCKDSAAPYCVNGQCVAQPDPCAAVTCTEGTCDRGICVTEAMLALDNTDHCSSSEFVNFCNGDKYVQCVDDTIFIDDCAGDGIGKCTVANVIGNKYEATCTGDPKAIEICKANPDAKTVDVCYGTQDWIASVTCITDVNGEVAIYPVGMSSDCKGVACSYNAEGKPSCGE